MYKRGQGSFYKHLDIFLADVVMLQVALLISYTIRHGMNYKYYLEGYRQFSILLVVFQVCFVFVTKCYSGYIRRGYLVEWIETTKYVTCIIALFLAYMFGGKVSEHFSRTVVFLTWGIGILCIYIERVILKSCLKKHFHVRDSRQILAIGEYDCICEIAKKNAAIIYKDYALSGLVVVDQDHIGAEIHGVPVIGHRDIPEVYRNEHVIDEVIFYEKHKTDVLEEIEHSCFESGITVHRVLADNSIFGNNTIVESLCGYTMLTSSIKMATAKELFIKRCIDIAGGIIGVILTVALMVILGPIIFICSPGPILFEQERVGMNGRRFKIYKFRSMYLDAERRKESLMKQNEMTGNMFKMKDDPRIIKGIGHFIRNTSLDEFPQFWNVLKGDMSLVGTRPPTVDEYEHYSENHRKRLSIRPGITGLWQVSGRSNITDFEEVVALDTEYIQDWCLKNDLKIIVKTLWIVLCRKGAE